MSASNYFSQHPVSKGHFHAMCVVATINTFNAAERVLDGKPEAGDLYVALDNGLITFEIGESGYYPSPTWLYIELQSQVYGVVEDD